MRTEAISEALTKPTPVLLADPDHPSVAPLFHTLSGHFDRVHIEALEHLLQGSEGMPSLVLLFSLALLSGGMEILEGLTRGDHPARVLLVDVEGEEADPHLVAKAFRFGASGYLSRGYSGEELIRAIQEVGRGKYYFNSEVAVKLIQVLAEKNEPNELNRSAENSGPRLTFRQREVLELIAQGKQMKEVAKALNISTRTAEAHKYDTMRKLGVESTAELIRYAYQRGLVSDPS